MGKQVKKVKVYLVGFPTKKGTKPKAFEAITNDEAEARALCQAHPNLDFWTKEVQPSWFARV